MAGTEAFLDSTALAARILEDRSNLPALLQKLDEYGARVTSQYVLMEIRRGLIRYLAFAYHCALNAQSFSEVLKKVEALLSTSQRYLPRTILQNIRGFFEEIENQRIGALPAQSADLSLGDYVLRGLASTLRLRIRNCWANIHAFVDRVINESGCYPDLEGPRQVGERFDASMPFCETLGITCNVVEFLSKHRSDVEKVLSAIVPGQSDKETEGRREALKSVLADPSSARDHRVCWKLGDAMICLEAPEGAHIVNNNPKHMDVICRAIGKRSVHWR